MVEQRSLTPGGVHDAGSETHHTTRRNLELKVYGVVALHHVDHLATAGAEDLDNLARVLAGRINDSQLDWLELLAVLIPLQDDLRAPNLELVALATHRLHENG